MITLKHLRIFVAVYKENGITLAAKRLGCTQPQVSVAIKEMEEHYETALFERSGRGIIKTQAANQLFEYASHILSMFDEMDEKMKGWNKAGRLRVGSSISIGICLMPDLVKRFSELHPEVEVCVTIDSSDIIESLLQEGKLDFAVIEGKTHSENLLIEPFMNDSLVLICNPENPLAKKSADKAGHITLEDIEEEPFLLRESNSATRNLAAEMLATHGFTLTPVWESTSTTALVNAVIAGLGVSILPRRFLADYIESGAVVPLVLDGIDFKRTYNIIYHKNKYLTDAAIAFFDMLDRIDSLDA